MKRIAIGGINLSVGECGCVSFEFEKELSGRLTFPKHFESNFRFFWLYRFSRWCKRCATAADHGKGRLVVSCHRSNFSFVDATIEFLEILNYLSFSTVSRRRPINYLHFHQFHNWNSFLGLLQDWVTSKEQKQKRNCALKFTKWTASYFTKIPMR